MPRNEFMPTNDAQFLVWHDKMKAAATTIGTALGITADDLTEIGTDNTAAHAKVNAAVTASTAAQTAIHQKNDALADVKANVRLFAKRVKGHRDYTEAQGIQLGIVGAEDTTDMTVEQPTLAGNPLPGFAVEVGFTKSNADAVDIYGTRDGDGASQFLGRDTQSPYVDNRLPLVPGKPEIRKYKGIYVVKNQQIGSFSDEITVVCQP